MSVPITDTASHKRSEIGGRSVMSDAQYPLRTIALSDEDGNPLSISY